MCIMEVREGQHDSTIAQACTHNLFTVVGDLAMFRRKIEAERSVNGDTLTDDRLSQVDTLTSQLHQTYETGLSLYGQLLADSVVKHRHYDDPIAEELDYTTIKEEVWSAARADEREARKFETR